MANQSGSVYGLPFFRPSLKIHMQTFRMIFTCACIWARCLAMSVAPFAKVTSTHIARLTVMNDVVFVGSPAIEEHLQSQYLVFESNFDGDLDTYLRAMATEIPEHVDAVWSHCVGYPGIKNIEAFQAYIKKCQLTTTFYFADVNNKTVDQTLRALQTQAAVAAFIEKNQGKPAEELQQAFTAFLKDLQAAPAPVRGSGLNFPQRYQTATVGGGTGHE